AFEKKFDGINLQSKLEESLKNLNTSQTHPNTANMNPIHTSPVQIDPGDVSADRGKKPVDDTLGETKIIRK
ncbi:MAG: hypothetical protein LIV24_03510, partial [Eubacterium sp.]|nr:hypothetical protein [Eubacterium sp.]